MWKITDRSGVEDEVLFPEGYFFIEDDAGLNLIFTSNEELAKKIVGWLNDSSAAGVASSRSGEANSSAGG